MTMLTAQATDYDDLELQSLTRTSTPRPRVVVVDDDLACRVLAAVLIEQAGYSPTAVATIDRALERIEELAADLVLTDLHMPGGGGLELLERLLWEGSPIPAIAMTGSDDQELVRRALALGAMTVLRKPLEPHELQAALDAALEEARVIRLFAAIHGHPGRAQLASVVSLGEARARAR